MMDAHPFVRNSLNLVICFQWIQTPASDGNIFMGMFHHVCMLFSSIRTISVASSCFCHAITANIE